MNRFFTESFDMVSTTKLDKLIFCVISCIFFFSVLESLDRITRKCGNTFPNCILLDKIHVFIQRIKRYHKNEKRIQERRSRDKFCMPTAIRRKKRYNRHLSINKN